jgi:glycine/D-amino acid oxidase-like deaminating enzyme
MGRVPDPRVNRPLWLEGVSTVFPPLEADRDVDVAVIGAGITGVTAAYLLKAAGKRVALVEASRVGFGATGYTTAKLTVGHNLIYRDLVDSFGVEIAALYARSNQEAIDSIADLVQEPRVRL